MYFIRIKINLVLAFAAITLILTFSTKAYALNENVPKTIPVYSYHLKPPLIINQVTEEGLYYDLLRYLSDHTVQYFLVYMPRKRIDRFLDSDNINGIIIGVSPHWFKDSKQQKYLWTSSFLSDQDDILSTQTNPFDFSKKTLRNKTMAGVRGFFYVNIDPIAEQYNVRRFDAESEKAVLEMIIRERVNFGIVSKSTFRYLAKKNIQINKLHISNQPHERFNRRFLVPLHKPNIHSHIDNKLKAVLKSKHWQELLDFYGMSLARTE